MVDFFYVNRMLEVGGVVVFDDVQLPSIAKVLAHVATYDCYRPLPPPRELTRDVRVRARRLAGVPALRVSAVEKTSSDDRDWCWYREF